MNVLMVPRHYDDMVLYQRPSLQSHLAAMISDRHRVEVLIPRVESETKGFSEISFGNSTVPCRTYVRAGMVMHRTLPWLWSYVRAFFEAGRPHRDLPWDLVYVHESFPTGFAAALLAKKLGVPVLLHQHSYNEEFQKNRFSRLLHAWTLRHVDHILVPSRALKQDVEKLTKKPVTVVPNPVDAHFFREDYPSVASNETPELLMVANFTEQKGLSIALEAVAKLRSKQKIVHLSVIGRVSPEKIEGVTFLGVLSPGEVAQKMVSSDLICVLSRRETFGLPAAEAIVTGKPVLSTRCGGPEDFLNESNCIFVERTAESVVQGILKWMESKQRFDVHRIRKHAREFFQDERIRETLDQIFARRAS